MQERQSSNRLKSTSERAPLRKSNSFEIFRGTRARALISGRSINARRPGLPVPCVGEQSHIMHACADRRWCNWRALSETLPRKRKALTRHSLQHSPPLPLPPLPPFTHLVFSLCRWLLCTLLNPLQPHSWLPVLHHSCRSLPFGPFDTIYRRQRRKTAGSGPARA